MTVSPYRLFSIRTADQLRDLMADLVRPEKFWFDPGDNSRQASWSRWYGTFDAQVYPVPYTDAVDEYGSEREPEIDKDAREIRVHPFEWRATEAPSTRVASTISSFYSADLSNSAHRLHDSMVRLIAETCHRKRAKVFSDPATLDLLIELDDQELLIEAKSATAGNLSHKIRIALGQVTYYDYLRSRQTTKNRRRGIALTLEIQESHWEQGLLDGLFERGFDYATQRSTLYIFPVRAGGRTNQLALGRRMSNSEVGLERKEHSQILITLHPARRRARVLALSRFELASSLGFQYLRRVFGLLPQRGQECQKQPSMKRRISGEMRASGEPRNFGYILCFIFHPFKYPCISESSFDLLRI
jgi:hypothetical protein